MLQNLATLAPPLAALGAPRPFAQWPGPGRAPVPMVSRAGAALPAGAAPAAAAGNGGARGAAGSEREPLSRCLAFMLDEIDYGMLLVDADTHVVYLNHAARRELDAEHPLQVNNGELVTAEAGEAGLLASALAAAQRGLRKLLTLGRGEQRVGVSVVPLSEAEARAGTTLLMLGKRRVCEQLSMQGYARAVALTPAETRVLELLCGGVQPTEIAVQQGVAVSTVRTQIGSIRAKTGANSIRELVRQVAVLPPLVGALRSSAAAFGSGAAAAFGGSAAATRPALAA